MMQNYLNTLEGFLRLLEQKTTSNLPNLCYLIRSEFPKGIKKGLTSCQVQLKLVILDGTILWVGNELKSLLTHILVPIGTIGTEYIQSSSFCHDPILE